MLILIAAITSDTNTVTPTTSIVSTSDTTTVTPTTSIVSTSDTVTAVMLTPTSSMFTTVSVELIGNKFGVVSSYNYIHKLLLHVVNEIAKDRSG